MSSLARENPARCMRKRAAAGHSPPCVAQLGASLTIAGPSVLAPVCSIGAAASGEGGFGDGAGSGAVSAEERARHDTVGLGFVVAAQRASAERRDRDRGSSEVPEHRCP